ncbi:XRE family transcriptional regulator [Thermoanaerobacter sp. YS13]|uniref:helix-turn-helix domain-containing protein n=1 Tax=Thermoanaerobacter sp. YS13 TaxID=1511746 RepID=UPI000573D63E|nr:helix-turn-helix transcriptional regulator [Thermoanaerobacter sp. YS13]KHO63199.1 XRE family transcriptional regulator [Thermoanaerobacter sp. YS13]
MKRRLHRKIGRKLRELRRQSGFTRKQAAKYLGISQRQLARYERGTKIISVDVLEKLANLYGTDYRCLLSNKKVFTETITIRFEAHKVADEDLEVIAFVNRFVINLDNMYTIEKQSKLRQ